MTQVRNGRVSPTRVHPLACHRAVSGVRSLVLEGPLGALSTRTLIPSRDRHGGGLPRWTDGHPEWAMLAA